MKIVKFRKFLSELILNGEKTTTWRLFDDKNISVGDELILMVKETLEEFAKAKVLSVHEKPLGNLTDEDWEGHEKFSSDEEMYATYKIYYNQDVDENTLVKIIRFELV